MKSLVDDLVVMCDEIVDETQSSIINPINGINYCLIAVVLLVTGCLLLLVVIVVKHCMKRGLTIPY